MLVRAPEISKLVGLSPLTLVRWARAGFIPAVNPRGRLWLFDPVEVEKAVKTMGKFPPDKGGRKTTTGGFSNALSKDR